MLKRSFLQVVSAVDGITGLRRRQLGDVTQVLDGVVDTATGAVDGVVSSVESVNIG